MRRKVAFGVCLVFLGAVALSDSGGGRLPPPPCRYPGYEKGMIVEHVAFAIGSTVKRFGGPARWALGGNPMGTVKPADQHGRLYTGDPESDVRLFTHDKTRILWVIEKGQAWPIAGNDDLADNQEGDGPFVGFLAPGGYGGGYMAKVAHGNKVIVVDHGIMRKVERQEDGSWKVEIISGLGKKGRVVPGDGSKLSDLGGNIRCLSMDAKGNLLFILGGSLIKASPDGRLSVVITPEKVRKDFEEVYKKKWPGEKVPRISIGGGESLTLIPWKDGSIYGGGRCWPSAWKVTPEGRFVPLVGYAPKKFMKGLGTWGKGDPATYVPHCIFDIGVDDNGYVVFRNEIPSVFTRYEKDRVTVMQPDGTWGLGKGKEFRHRSVSLCLGRPTFDMCGLGKGYQTKQVLVRVSFAKKSSN